MMGKCSYLNYSLGSCLPSPDWFDHSDFQLTTKPCSTWVAHPALASIASEIFNKHMPTPNQLFNRREDVSIGQNDLLNMNVPGKITEEGIRKNLNIGLGYMEAWIRGVGCVPINYLM